MRKKLETVEDFQDLITMLKEDQYSEDIIFRVIGQAVSGPPLIEEYSSKGVPSEDIGRALEVAGAAVHKILTGNEKISSEPWQDFKVIARESLEEMLEIYSSASKSPKIKTDNLETNSSGRKGIRKTGSAKPAAQKPAVIDPVKKEAEYLVVEFFQPGSLMWDKRGNHALYVSEEFCNDVVQMVINSGIDPAYLRRGLERFLDFSTKEKSRVLREHPDVHSLFLLGNNQCTFALEEFYRNHRHYVLSGAAESKGINRMVNNLRKNFSGNWARRQAGLLNKIPGAEAIIPKKLLTPIQGEAPISQRLSDVLAADLLL